MKAIKVYKSGIHFGEEPIIAGNLASGMINFSGCHLSCHFCYTPETSREWLGEIYSPEQFQELCEGLVKRGARNLNLISPTQFFGAIARPLEKLNSRFGELLPIVLKVSGYESAPTVKAMAKTAHVFVPDFKVFDEGLAKNVGLPQRYATIALKAIEEMMSTHGASHYTETGKLTRGILIRHLLMPGCMDDSYNVVEALSRAGFQGHLNLMTYFFDPKTKKVTNAPPQEVTLLTEHAISMGMTPMVNGKSATQFRARCTDDYPRSQGGTHVG